jgi:ABC-2 type transport system ATP-binding protein
MALLRARELTKTFGQVRALDAVSFEIDEGITGLLGSNGAGKSTSLKLFLGLLDPDGGSADVLGQDPRTSPEYRTRVGYAPEHDCLPRGVSAAEFLAYLAQISGLPPTAARLRASDVLRHVGLFEERYRPMGTYSTGMKQRVKLAQALVHDPLIAFLDEPTAGLDPQSRLALWEILGELNREGQTIMLTTHYMEEADELCDRVAIMDHGRILALDTPESLKRSIGADTIVTLRASGEMHALAELLAREIAEVTRTRVLDASSADGAAGGGGVELHVKGAERLVPRVVGAAERGRFDVADISVSEPSLENVFINLTGRELRD